MRYSLLGKTGMNVSALGFGCMRLPMKGALVDRDKSTPLLRRAVDLGINFFDSAIGYCNHDSEKALGDAMQGVRDKVFLSTKNGNHHADPSEWRRHLENSLSFLRTDHLDLYNHHGINWDVFVKCLDPEKGGLTKEMIRAKEEGLVRHIGISFHDHPDSLKKLADTGVYENVILQYNLLDQANAEAMLYAREKGMGIVVMGPVGGGRLGLPSDTIRELTNGAASSTVEAALRFVWAHPAVNIALSGMESIQMLEENVRIAQERKPFTSQEAAALNQIVRQRKEKSGLYCTGCRYCTPTCPGEVQIPEILDILNNYFIYGLKDHAKNQYGSLAVNSSECIACGKCLHKCPQKIDIPARMKEATKLFDKRIGSVLYDARFCDIDPAGTFGLKISAHNLANDPASVEVRIAPEKPISAMKSQLVLDNIKPFSRKSQTLKGTFPVGSQVLAAEVEFKNGGDVQKIRKRHSFMMLKKGLADDWKKGTWHDVKPRPDEFTAAQETASLHGLHFCLSYDDAGLLILADVCDDFLFPSRPEAHKGMLVDGLELFLDGRRSERIGNANYEAGVAQIALYPGLQDGAPAFYHVWSSRKEFTANVSSERTTHGYRMKVRIPFLSFCVDTGVPRKIGFDLAVNTADRQGQRLTQYVFAGGPDNHRNAANFREIWLK
jgi:hypothetical protein